MLADAMFPVITLALTMLARVLTDRFATLAVRILHVEIFAVTMFPVVTLALTRFARVLTVRFVTFAAVETFRVTMLAVATFPEVTFAVRRLADTALMRVGTTRVAMFAETKLRDKMLRVPMLAVPGTYRLEPTGGFVKVPIVTPFANATLASILVHWLREGKEMFEALVRRPY